MLVAMLLMVVYRFVPDEFLFAGRLRVTSFGDALLRWFEVSFVILLLLTLKIVTVFVLSQLFGMRGVAGLHFFNVIRLLLIAAGSLSLVVFLYFVWRGQDPDTYTAILTIFILLSAVWIMVIFLKLNSRTEHSMFHLFSYICATEVMPLLIIVKVLFQ
jgi:hypothetical protein